MLTLMWQIVTILSASTTWLMFPIKIQQLTATSLRLELSPLPMSTVLPANRGHQITCYLLFLDHPAVYLGDFNSQHTDWGYSNSNKEGEMLSNWASCNDLALVYDSKQKGTFVSARWQREYSPDLCWVSSVCGHPQPATSSVLGNFPHRQHTAGHQSYTLAATVMNPEGLTLHNEPFVGHSRSSLGQHSIDYKRISACLPIASALIWYRIAF